MTEPAPDLGEQVKALDQLQAWLSDYIEAVWQVRPFPEWSPDPHEAERRLSLGRCLLPEVLQPDPAAAALAARLLADLLEEALPAQGEALRSLRQVVEAEPLSFLGLVLGERGGELLARCRAAGVPDDLATFHAVLFGRPFRAWYARRIADAISLDGWKDGSCPVCGHWPSLSLIDDSQDGRRYLWCLHCGTHWRHPRLKCAFCGCDEAALLHSMSLDGQEGYRLQECSRCKRYLKEARSTGERGRLPWDAIYLGTAELDEAALGHGFLRESPLIGQRQRQAAPKLRGQAPPSNELDTSELDTSSNSERNR